MEQTNNFQFEQQDTQEEQSSLNFETIYKMLILNWEWFLLSIIICLGMAFLYLRYKSPVYSTSAKVLIKEEQRTRGSRTAAAFSSLASLQDITSFGITNYGIDNEIEIIKSTQIATQAIRDLKIYTTYWGEGRIKDHLLYNEQPINVDVDPINLEKLNTPIKLKITYKDNAYHVEGEYNVPINEITFEGPYFIDKTFNKLPAVVKTGAGTITISHNPSKRIEALEEGKYMKAKIVSPRMAALSYAKRFSVEPVSKQSDVLSMNLTDQNIQRGIDFLNQLILCYNKQANDDKNEVSARTEEFINDRLEKISAELGTTEGELENFKKRNNIVELKTNASSSIAQVSTYEQKLTEANTQIALVNSLINFVNSVSDNGHEILPANIGLTDNSSISLIDTYNQMVLERKKLLKTASENNPSIQILTSQLDDLKASIHKALSQVKRTSEIQRDAIYSRLGQYSGAISKTPEQERILTQIGRQQEIKSGLYLMLLQKREENSISLAATSDKGKIIEMPQYEKKVSPKGAFILLVALIFGFAIPIIIIYIRNFFRFRIEGHDDVEMQTSMPILADIAVATEGTKTRGDIVVHENRNNMMEEIFRSLRTNVQFMLKENEKTILFTSSLSGEGKTFISSNLAVSFALLGKKVILVGLDIRKPRLAELFEIDNKKTGITNLLVKAEPTWEEITEQILPSGVNNNLDLLMAGPIAPNPAELVNRHSLDVIMNHLSEHYDYILIDSAPVGLVSDTISIGRVANITICVCRADYTPKKCFAYLNTLNKEDKMPNMTTVINGIDMSKKKYSYSYGYGKYSGYSKYGKSKSYSYTSSYGDYSQSHYGDANDTSIKK